MLRYYENAKKEAYHIDLFFKVNSYLFSLVRYHNSNFAN